MHAILQGISDESSLDGDDTTIDDSFDSTDPDDTVVEYDVPFDWMKCSWDQMFVFNPDSSQFIVNVLVNKLRPWRTGKRCTTPIGANGIFLCLRYSHYYSSAEVMKSFFDICIDEIINAIQINRSDISFVCYWIKNSFVLLSYLQKDAGLMGVTIEYQCTLNELIQSLCAICIRDLETRLIPLLPTAILDYQSVDADLKHEGMIEGVSRSGIISWSASTLRDGLAARGTPGATPKSLVAVLDDTLDTLRCFESIMTSSNPSSSPRLGSPNIRSSILPHKCESCESNAWVTIVLLAGQGCFNPIKPFGCADMGSRKFSGKGGKLGCSSGQCRWTDSVSAGVHKCKGRGFLFACGERVGRYSGPDARGGQLLWL